MPGSLPQPGGQAHTSWSTLEWVILTYLIHPGPEVDVSVTISAANAKATFAECLRSAERGETVVVTRHGRPVAAIVAPSDWEQIARLRSADPMSGLGGLVGAFDDADEFVEALDGINRSSQRSLPEFEED